MTWIVSILAGLLLGGYIPTEILIVILIGAIVVFSLITGKSELITLLLVSFILIAVMMFVPSLMIKFSSYIGKVIDNSSHKWIDFGVLGVLFVASVLGLFKLHSLDETSE